MFWGACVPPASDAPTPTNPKQRTLQQLTQTCYRDDATCIDGCLTTSSRGCRACNPPRRPKANSNATNDQTKNQETKQNDRCLLSDGIPAPPSPSAPLSVFPFGFRRTSP